MVTKDEAGGDGEWPVLRPFAEWRDTAETLHMWLQIAGKIRLACAPFVNHSWGCTLYITTRGMTTSPIPYGPDSFAIDFDFVDHALRITRSDRAERSFDLRPMSVAEFYRQMMATLEGLDIRVNILARPVEVEVAIPFAEDHTHASYDVDAVDRLWRAFAAADRVLKEFRAGFIGKASPSHLFWGAMDIAATRFSGRTAPRHPGGAPNVADWVMVEAYSHELSSAGFWPGAGLGEPAFYSYAYPYPDGFKDAAIEPEAGVWHEALGEFVLPYEAVQSAQNPEEALHAFLRTTYDAAAKLARWDRNALERR